MNPAPPQRRLADRAPKARAQHHAHRAAHWVSAHVRQIVSGALISAAALLIVAALVVNYHDDRAERRASRVESQRTCRRTYQVGPDILAVLVRGGLGARAARIYMDSVPKGPTIDKACP